MFEVLACGYNIFCHLDNINNSVVRSKYPQNVVQLCVYFEQQKVQLPDYCFRKTEIKPPRHRNEY
jgi:hypothetical protein